LWASTEQELCTPQTTVATERKRRKPERTSGCDRNKHNGCRRRAMRGRWRIAQPVSQLTRCFLNENGTGSLSETLVSKGLEKRLFGTGTEFFLTTGKVDFVSNWILKLFSVQNIIQSSLAPVAVKFHR
jgi:hypothetical protein